jgi:hypothetical protein
MNRMRGWGRGWGLAFGMLLGTSALAQDAHYTTRQFGNRAWLLGGAFVGNPDDISAVYYNPGALGLLSAPELELTGSVYELTRIRVVDGLGPGTDLTSANLSALPSLVAGSLRLGFLGKSKLAYSLLTRQGFDFSLQARGTRTGADLAGVTGMDRLSTDVNLEQSISEYWAGLSWAMAVGKHLGVGLSPFVAFRQQQVRFQALGEGSGANGQRLLATLDRDMRLTHLRVLLKLGASYQHGPWALGATVTTPSLALWGRGAAGYERSIQSQGFDTNAPASVFDFQQGLPVRFHSPGSLSLGASRAFGRTTVYASAEGYLRVKAVTLVDSAPITPRDSTEVIDGDFDMALKPVVNGALGVEQKLGAHVRAYLSGHTDFSALDATPGTNALLAGWDLYHVATGAHFLLGRSRFTLGGDLAWGGKTTTRLADALRETGLAPPTRSHDVRFFQATVLLGASFSLVDKRDTGGEVGAGDDADAEAR